VKKPLLSTIVGVPAGVALAAWGVWTILYGTPGQLQLFYRVGIALSLATSIASILTSRWLRNSRLRMEAERQRYEEGREQYEASAAAMRRARQTYENIWPSRVPRREGGVVRATGVRVMPHDHYDDCTPAPPDPPREAIEAVHPRIEWDPSWPSALPPGNAQAQ